LIIARKGSVGGIFEEERPSWPIDTVYFARESSALDRRYAYWFFLFFRLDRLDQSTAVPSLSRDKYNDVLVPIAPVAEQRRIVARIDELFTEIADGETALARARDGLDTWRRSLLKAAVTGELTRQWREKNFISADWTLTTIGEAGELRLGRQRSPEHHYGKNMRPYLRVANVFEARLDLRDVKSMNFTPDEYEIYRLDPGDVLLNEGQSPHLLGRPAIFKGEVDGCCFQNTLLRFRPHEGLTSEFALLVFRYYMHSGRFKRESRITTNLAHLSQTRCAAIEFPVPSAAEQLEIVQTVRSLEEQTFEQFEHIEMSAIGSLRQSILKAAFEGGLSEQDPRDEPADRLLACLSEQKEAMPSVGRPRRRRAAIAAE
jgi:type I restriction enzyme S subunit